MSINKKINRLLKKKDLVVSKIFSHENKFTRDQWNKIEELYLIPPKSAILKMSQISKLYKLRHKGKWTKKDFIMVIEPQRHDKVTKLTPKDYMFQKNYFIKNNKEYRIGYFYSDNSGIAYSGTGKDVWWLANESMIKWLNKVITKGMLIVDKIKKK